MYYVLDSGRPLHVEQQQVRVMAIQTPPNNQPTWTYQAVDNDRRQMRKKSTAESAAILSIYTAWACGMVIGQSRNRRRGATGMISI